MAEYHDSYNSPRHSDKQTRKHTKISPGDGRGGGLVGF